ncbi:MAG: hypothetical protein GYB49_17625 [Alphaproteobacteria bacterium]|nr:hypothetical protein [Hyphomonas sp.]MBR9809037.1 hypothetical protein [Alphaproteobacteria bacterium]
MMVRNMMIAAAIGAMTAGSAAAEGPKAGEQEGMLHWIRDTVCTSGREIVFVPVSTDVKTRHKTWAVIAMDDPDPDSAHIVTTQEKSWLKANGCDADRAPQVHMASHEEESGGLDL